MYRQHFPTRFTLWLLILLPFLEACNVSAPTMPMATTSTPPSTAATTPIATVLIPTPVKAKSQPTDNWVRDWLQGIPCRAPCWLGITPGRTPASEALDILNRSPLISTIQGDELPSISTNGFVLWDGRAGGYGNLWYSGQNESLPVTGINVWFPTRFSLEEIIEAYGTPSHVLPLEAQAHDPHGPKTAIIYELVVVYLAQGFYLTLPPEHVGKPTITPDLILFGHVRFFPPTASGFDLFAMAQHVPWMSADLVPWQSTQTFDWFCAQMRPVKYNICGGGYQPEPS